MDSDLQATKFASGTNRTNTIDVISSQSQHGQGCPTLEKKMSYRQNIRNAYFCEDTDVILDQWNQRMAISRTD